MLTNADGCGIISSFPREHGNPNKGKPKRNLANCINCWCGSMAEQLICNQQVVGSTPITSSNTVCRLRTVQLGGIPEWPKGTDCKSAGTAFGGSNPPLPTKKKTSQCGVFFYAGNRGFCAVFTARRVAPEPPVSVLTLHLCK